ncbi:hypothetical protein Glove_60g70 [Diversispora epigaea]|uniref:Uncharacterized protein n=1 Tax=Diversispora epigaea TaxID=1348612 RepID=A0A397JF01_9GLOM|nr:hypothetical protein Glove_60g70 [Diversispora epigaea]
MKHMDFHKQLVTLIFNYYSMEEMEGTIANRTKKRKNWDSNNLEHNLISINNDSTNSQIKGKYIQRHCISCHKRTSTSCSCSIPWAMCTNCWANHIHNSYNIVRTR